VAGPHNDGNFSLSAAGIDSDVVSGTITLDDGNGHTATYSLSAADIAAGTVTLDAADFTGFAGLDDGNVTATISVTDDASNNASANDTFQLDNDADVGDDLSVTVAGPHNDGNFSLSAAGIDSDVVSGTITLDDGNGHTATYSLSAADIAAGTVTLDAADFTGFAGLEDGNVTATISVTDDASNHASANDTFQLDNDADVGDDLSVTVAGPHNDGNFSLSAAGIDSDVVSGTITLDDGNGHTATYSLSAADIAAGTVTL